jgi:hypothetical protein
MTVTTTPSDSFSPRSAAGEGPGVRGSSGPIPVSKSVASHRSCPVPIKPPPPSRFGRARAGIDFAGIFSVKQRVPSRSADQSGPGPCSRKCPDRTPTPSPLFSWTLDHAFGGSWTLDLGLAWRCPVPSRLAMTVPGRRRAPRTTPPQAGFRQPTAPSIGQRSPRFYAPGNNSEFSRSKAGLGAGEEMPGGPAAVECASGGCLTPLGLRTERIGWASRSQACAALRPGL